MGQLVDGVWQEGSFKDLAKGGAFKRFTANFRNWVTADGAAGPSGDSGFQAEPGRYHLYVSLACPWAHRALIFRNLKGLRDLIGVSVVHPDLLAEGWCFDTEFEAATGDRLFGFDYLYQVYTKAAPEVTGRVTVPVLWDKATGRIVSNESSEIIRMFNSAFDHLTGNDLDFWPEEMREAIAPINDRIYDTLNNGVYKAGFATTQAAYDDAVYPLFDTLDWLEARLSGRRYVMGARVTEADWRLFTTLIRFDTVYHGHFKCNRRRIAEYPSLSGWLREMYQWPGVAETVDLAHIARHYHYSHESVNPHRIVPIGPVLDLDAPHGRDGLPAQG